MQMMFPRIRLLPLVLALAASGCVGSGSLSSGPESPASGPSEAPASTPTTSAASLAPPTARPSPSARPTASPSAAPARSLLPDEIPLPTQSPGGHGLGDALFPDVRLAGDPDLNGGCIWVELTADVPGGARAGTRTSVVWPYGFRGFRDPLRLVGPDGRVVAHLGDVLSLGGGSPPVDFVIPPEMDPCKTGQVFAAGEVVSVNGVVVRIGAPPSPQP